VSITKPTSGKTITPSSVSDMHTALRTTVNAIDPTSVGRQSINHHQLGTASLVQKSTVSNQTTFTLIDNVISNYNSSTTAVGLIYTNAAQLLSEVTSWDLLNSITYSGGFQPKTGSPMIIQYNLHLMDLRDASGNAVQIPKTPAGLYTSFNFMIFFALVLERTAPDGSTANVVIEESVNGVDFNESLYYYHNRSQTNAFAATVDRDCAEQPVAFTVMHETLEGYTYNSVKLYSAICPTLDTSTVYKGNVTNGVLSVLCLEPGA
tara:strand:+ start:1910 stop:2698 length:789 start_codon:yes stop_codon:yes gene_type:complete